MVSFSFWIQSYRSPRYWSARTRLQSAPFCASLWNNVRTCFAMRKILLPVKNDQLHLKNMIVVL